MLDDSCIFKKTNEFRFCLHFIHRQFPYCLSISCRISLFWAGEITEPFGNRYPPLCLNTAQEISPCPLYTIPTSSHRSRNVRLDGFSFGSICRPERLIILCTRDPGNILHKYNQGCEFCPNNFLVFIQCYVNEYSGRADPTDRKCLASYWMASKFLT